MRRASMHKRLRRGARRRSSRWSTSSSAERKADPNAVFAGSVPYLMLAGNLVAGWQMARALLVAEDQLAARRRRRGVHAREDRDGALLRRAHPEQGARACATPSSKAPTSVTAMALEAF